VIKKPREWGG